MEKPIREERVGSYTVKVYQDSDPQKPDDWGDNNLFLVHYHRDFWIENKEILCENDLRDLYLGNETDSTEKLKDEFFFFPVSAYIHSGVQLSLESGNFNPFDSQGWDTSHVGAVFVSKGEFKTLKESRKCAEGLIETWNTYLSGNVYGFVVEDKDGEHKDSCWGFYGEPEGALKEGVSIAEHCIKEALEKHQKKLKGQIKHKVPIDKRVSAEV